MKAEDSHSVILFDGFCHLCNGVVKFVLKRDSKHHIHFAPLQSEAGLCLLKAHGVPHENIDSIVLLEAGKWSIESTSALRIVRHLRWPWSLLYFLIIIPRSVRDAVYRWIARNRYRWFGKSQTCMVPKPEWLERFLG